MYGKIIRKIGRLLIFFSKALLDIVLHFIRRCVLILFNFILAISCHIIFLVTWEPRTWKRVTVRKVKRIRALTKLKLYAWKYGKPFFVWLKDEYMRDLYNNYYYLIEKE